MNETNLREALLRAVQARDRVAADMMRRRNVVACGVGYKSRAAQRLGIPSVIVSVTRKLPRETLRDDDVIPAAVEDVPTDVIETGEIAAHSLDRRARVRPVRPGVSISHQSGSAGTAGCIVRRGDQMFILSNNHVLALLNQASQGDAILQPGPSDGGSLLDQIGELEQFIPLKFLDEPGAEAVSHSAEPGGCAGLLRSLISALTSLSRPRTALPVPLGPPVNYVDAALARPLDSIPIDPKIVDIGGLPLGIAEPALGLRVIKSGRTTSLTQATVVQIAVTVDVRYGDRVARFANQIMTTPFSQPGDSGSLVMDYERKAVGLLFSGSDKITVVNPMMSVLSALDVELLIEPV